MRKLKQKYKTLFISVAIMLYLFIALGFSSQKASEKRCTSINIKVLNDNINKFISEKDIDRILEKNEFNIIGYPVKKINSLLIENIVQKHPSIEQVEVYTNVKGSVNIIIQQRQPLVRVLQQNGDSYYIDNHGFLMPLSDNYTARVLVVTGDVNRNFKDFKNQDLKLETADTLLYRIFLLSKNIQNDKYWSAMCNQICVSNKQDLILIPKIGANEIFLGRKNKFKKDLKTLTVFYTEVLSVVGWEKYSTINLQYNQQIVCK